MNETLTLQVARTFVQMAKDITEIKAHIDCLRAERAPTEELVEALIAARAKLTKLLQGCDFVQSETDRFDQILTVLRETCMEPIQRIDQALATAERFIGVK